MKKQAFTALFLVILTVGMVSTASAASSSDGEDSNVTVTITSTTALDVKPDNLAYNGVGVGNRTKVSTNGHGFEKLKIENTGSDDIQRIWTNTTYPTSNPFGSGVSASYDTGNFIQIRQNGTQGSASGDSSVFHFPQRVEFFESSTPLVNLGTFDDSETVNVGRIRLGDNEFYYALQQDGNTCNGGSATIRVGNVASTPTSLGTVDFSTGGNFVERGVTSTGNNYGVTQDDITFDLNNTQGVDSAESQTYDILTKCDVSSSPFDDGHIILSKYNIEAGGSDNLEGGTSANGTATTSIWKSVGTADNTQLNPGESFPVDVAVQIPRGVPAGQITQGTMTVFAQATQ